MTHRKLLFLHLWHLWVIAAILRLGYFLLALQHLGMEKLWNTNPDTRKYEAIAEWLLSDNPRGLEPLFRYGPGYGFILAGLQTILGASPLYAYLLNILIGSLAPVCVYLIAYYLTRSKAVALIAGAISALSTTSIALSCNILSDQSFFVVHALSILCFILGFRSGKKSWFIVTGLTAGFAAYLRGIGQFWPILLFLVPVVLPLCYEPVREELPRFMFSSRLAMIKRAGLAAAAMLVLVLAWSARNYIVHDAFVFGNNGVSTARQYLLARAVAEHTNGVDIREIHRRWEEEDLEFFGGRTPTLAELYQRDRDQLWRVSLAHPGWVSSTFLKTVWENVSAGNELAAQQVPVFKGLWGKLNSWNGKWLAPLIVLAVIAGLVFFYVDRFHLAWLLLGATYAYFTVITGFSFWQGSRFHYPAQMAWAILVAYAAFRVGLLLMKPARRFNLYPAILKRITGAAHRFAGLRRPKDRA